VQWNDIRRQAREMGVKTGGKKKFEVIRAVQRAEGNFDCFGRSGGYCDQVFCAWRDDCLAAVRKSA